MIFKPALVAEIVAGGKRVTRRRITHRDGRPLRYVAGKTYALQPGRGKAHVGHLAVWHVDTMPLGAMAKADAMLEGFENLGQFYAYWHDLHGSLDLEEPVAVIEFRYLGRRECCV